MNDDMVHILRIRPEWAPLVIAEQAPEHYRDARLWRMSPDDGWTARRMIEWGQMATDLTCDLVYVTQRNVN